MADTRRTDSALATLFADNTAGAISAQDLRDFLESRTVHVAAAAPTASDDDTAGFDVGHVWKDTASTPDSFHKCMSAATGSAVWAQIYPASAAWGSISGTLSDQTDLDTALGLKADTSSLGTAAAADTGDFATATQGGLADTAVQPGDDAADLGSGAATDGYVLTADGAGGAAWEAVPAGGSPAWGDVTGTLSNQTDLQTALDAKLAKLATINSYAGNTTLDSDDSGAYVRITAAGTVTLPDGLATGFQCVIVNATDAATVALSAATTLTIPSGFDAEVANRRAVTVIHVGSNVWEAHGALVETP